MSRALLTVSKSLAVNFDVILSRLLIVILASAIINPALIHGIISLVFVALRFDNNSVVIMGFARGHEVFSSRSLNDV